MPAIKLHLFGAPYLELDGEPVTLDTRKAIALFAYCALTGAGGVQSRFFEAVCRVLMALAADLTGFQKPVSSSTTADRSSTPPPGTLSLDDIHWADDASLDLLAYLVKRLASYPLLLFVAWRSGAQPIRHPTPTWTRPNVAFLHSHPRACAA